MREEVIKDFYGRIIGYIRTEPNGNQVALNFYKQKLGTYDKQRDITKDFYGRILSKGNMLSSLILSEEINNNAKRMNNKTKNN